MLRNNHMRFHFVSLSLGVTLETSDISNAKMQRQKTKTRQKRQNCKEDKKARRQNDKRQKDKRTKGQKDKKRDFYVEMSEQFPALTMFFLFLLEPLCYRLGPYIMDNIFSNKNNLASVLATNMLGFTRETMTLPLF